MAYIAKDAIVIGESITPGQLMCHHEFEGGACVLCGFQESRMDYERR